MKRTSRQTNKLKLQPETLRLLDEQVLQRAVGGVHGTELGCPTGKIPVSVGDCF